MASNEDQAKAVLKSMKNASETVRSAIATAIPVANNQVFTVALPGTIIDWKEYYYNVSRHVKPPLDIQVKEARLVDGMIPLSKFTTGKTGKSVARSYLAALDLLLPVEASVSSAVVSEAEVTDPRLKTIRERYNHSMNYLTSADDTPTGAGKTKVDTYVVKQAAWAKVVSEWAAAQAGAMERFKPAANATTGQIKEAQEKYMAWIQEHAREFKHTIQTKYMDWVVHGYKFMVDFHFGVVDISSGMKRIENSKEAYRNLTVIASDGSSEYNTVALNPATWATIIANKVVAWQKNNSEPNPTEIRAEIRRLENLKTSHTVLQEAIKGGAFFPVLSNDKNKASNGQDKLKAAYAEVYSDMDRKNETLLKGDSVAADDKAKFLKAFNGQDPTVESKSPDLEDTAPADEGKTPVKLAKSSFNPLERLQRAQKEATEASLNKTNNSVRQKVANEKDVCNTWISARVEQIDQEIKSLKSQLQTAEQASSLAPPMLPVLNSDGVIATDEELRANPDLVKPSTKKAIELDNEDTWRNMAGAEPDPWTRVACKVSAKSDLKEASTSESASAVAAKAGWGFFSASGGASHSQSTAEAMQQMSNLDVEISMSCMVVEIERPWLHAELFVDAELDSGKFNISPGEAVLKHAYENDLNLEGEYQQFSSYPSAFVVASDIELTFSGDTTKLESAVSASRTAANVSVGYGPFAISASHSSSKSKSRTKMESTATGCRISVEAPQIVGWVQTLLPELPKRKDGVSKMIAPFH